ncbi:hypothetical protein [Actinoplanes sp. DH11]|uniref:hypothetical protein n=1 Tax=Actinoplanes sp. DH11 TaxID=2857011 RepID=UPI001E5DD24E|nr:hypothetical protein [Actinoplanes sp. DH11]
MVLAIAAVTAVLLAGVAAVGVSRLLTDTPRSTVADYFEALAEGDASAALDLVFLGDKIDPAQYPLLTDGGLDAGVRPSDVRIGDSRDADPGLGRQATVVPVRYSAGGTGVSQDILVVRADDDGYALRAPFVTLAVGNAQGRAVKVNGIALGGQADLVGFPGVFRAEAAANVLLGAATATAVAAPGMQGGYVAPLDFGVPELAPGAAKKIQAEVRATIDRCAGTTAAQIPGCPFGLTVWGQNATVRWTVAAYPKVTVRPAAATWFGGGGVTITDDGAGTVRWMVTYVDGTGVRRTEKGSAPFRVNGIAQVSASGIQITLG